jgi:hypothetical protein
VRRSLPAGGVHRQEPTGPRSDDVTAATDPSLILSAADILGAKDADTREFVECPEWGHVEVEVPAAENAVDQTPKKVKKPKGVYVRGLTLKERGVVRRMATESVPDPDAPNGKRDALDAEKMESLMVVSCACDGNGRPIFRREDHEALMERLGGPINRIAKKAMELSGMLLTEKKVQG